MAIQKYRLQKIGTDESTDIIHLETSSDMVVRPDGTTVEDALGSSDIVEARVLCSPNSIIPNEDDGVFSGLILGLDKEEYHGTPSDMRNTIMPGCRSIIVSGIRQELSGISYGALSIGRSHINDKSDESILCGYAHKVYNSNGSAVFGDIHKMYDNTYTSMFGTQNISADNSNGMYIGSNNLAINVGGMIVGTMNIAEGNNIVTQIYKCDSSKTEILSQESADDVSAGWIRNVKVRAYLDMTVHDEYKTQNSFAELLQYGGAGYSNIVVLYAPDDTFSRFNPINGKLTMLCASDTGYYFEALIEIAQPATYFTKLFDTVAFVYKNKPFGRTNNTNFTIGALNLNEGNYSMIFGVNNRATISRQIILGDSATVSTSTTDRLLVGKGQYTGTSSGGATGTAKDRFDYGDKWTARANCLRVTDTGVYASGNYNASGADYAEMFEWLDNNPDHEDRVGKFVTLDGDKLKLATSADDFILGVVSGNPSIVGDVHDDQWQGMYLYDIFGRPIFETVEIPEWTEEIPIDPNNPDMGTESIVHPATTETRQKLNPAYDNQQAYQPRTSRPEWSAVGLMGKLIVIDDGTAQVNGYVSVSDESIATHSATKTKYRVMKRLDENHIQILIL